MRCNQSAQSGPGGPIFVVGAGPTGLVLAIELLRRGIGVRLIDRLPEPPQWSQAIFIKQRTLEILANLGLIERFAEEGQWVRGVVFYSDGRDIAAYDFKAIDSPYPNILSLPESATIRLLTEAVHALGGEVEHSTQFEGLTQDENGVEVRLLSAEHGPSTARFSYVVGADGYRSTVRDAIHDDYEGTDYQELWGVFDTQLAHWTRPRDTVCAQLEAPIVLPFPLGADHWRIYFRPDNPGEGAVAAVLARLRGICPQVEFVAPNAPQYFHSHSRLARTFHIGRVFLAGDAAHASNPIQGHGMNAGIQDAFNLGWKLAAAVTGRGTDALLRSYDAERRVVDGEVVASGEEAYGWMTDTTGEKLAALYAFLSTPDGRALAAIAETEIGYAYGESPIIVQRPEDGAAQKVGARVGDVAGLVHRDGTTTLHALLAHPEPTVLLLHGDAHDDARTETARRIGEILAPFGGVRFFAVGTEAPPPSMADTFVHDPRGELHARFGGAGPTLCVIRPDGHLSLCCGPGDVTALAAHLNGMFHPQPTA